MTDTDSTTKQLADLASDCSLTAVFFGNAALAMNHLAAGLTLAILKPEILDEEAFNEASVLHKEAMALLEKNIRETAAILDGFSTVARTYGITRPAT